MNWLAESSWLWKALRGRSITFAAVFALGVLGLSVVRIFRHLLASLGVPWLLLLVLPLVVIGAIARREEEWVPDEDRRKRWSRRLVFGAIGASVLMTFLAPKHPPADPPDSRSTETSVRRHGPSGK